MKITMKEKINQVDILEFIEGLLKTGEFVIRTSQYVEDNNVNVASNLVFTRRGNVVDIDLTVEDG